MKDFSRPSGRLRSLPLAARIVYSVFSGFTLTALVMTAWLANDIVGPSAERVSEYYAGVPSREESVPASNVSPSDTGPTLDLPPDADAPPEPTGMPRRKLLEITHFHLFSMPVYLLILSHLFMLSTMRIGPKIAWIVSASVATVAHMAAPWIAAANTSGARAFYEVSGALLGLSYLVMAAWPLWEMWTTPVRVVKPPSSPDRAA